MSTEWGAEANVQSRSRPSRPNPIDGDDLEWEADWNLIKINVAHSKVQMQSKLHVKVKSTACKIDLNQTVDMEMNSTKTMVKIQDLQPACQYKSTFTVGLFSGK